MNNEGIKGFDGFGNTYSNLEPRSVSDVRSEFFF